MEFAPPPAARFEVDIGEAEVRAYEENGYLAVARVTTDEELAWLRDTYDALLARPRTGFLDGVFDLSRPYGVKDEPKLGQLLFPERFVAAIRSTAMWTNARRIASRLLRVDDRKIESWGHLIFKAAKSGGVTPWHQDEAYWDVALEYDALGSWMPLDDVDTKNGCLWFVPGSHRGDVLKHRHHGGDPAVHVLELDQPADTSGGVPVPLAAGGMTFHHARTLHYAGPNATDRIRRAWANEFQTAPRKREHPADRPWVHEGLKALDEARR